jgi:Mg2+/Co2+ transporter CorC
VVDLGQFRFRVLRADNRRLHLLELTLLGELGDQPLPAQPES